MKKKSTFNLTHSDGNVLIQSDGVSIQLDRSSAELLACLILSSQSGIESELFYSVWRSFSAALHAKRDKSAQSRPALVVSLPKSQGKSSPPLSPKRRQERSQGQKSAKGHS